MARTTVVFGLWLAPQFSPAMEAGNEPPPYINHDEISWPEVLSDLRTAFRHCIQRVSLRIADDTIDQTVVHFRGLGYLSGSIDCKDFGQILQSNATSLQADVVPIRSEWQPLQYIQDRTHAPPPIAIPLIISGSGTEIAIALHSIQLLLGVQAAHDMIAAMETPPDELPEDFHEGYLPAELLQSFKRHFGVPYKKYCTLTPLVDLDPVQMVYG